jgi:hypothetical protein
MSALTAIVKKARVLYRTGKYKKWTDAIKAASKGVKKAAPKKKATKKAAPKRKITKRKPIGDVKVIFPSKKKATHKVIRKKNGTFKKFQSINGLGNFNVLNEIKKIDSQIEGLLKASLRNKEQLKDLRFKTPFWQKTIKAKNNKISKAVASLKKQKISYKKLI